MEIVRKVVIGGQPLLPTTLNAHLALSTAGAAIVRMGPEALTPGPADPRTLERILAGAKGKLAECFVSVAGQQEYLVLLGPVTQVKRVGVAFEVSVRELATVLNALTAIYSRQCSAREVISKIEQKTGLRFIVPVKAPYLDEIKPVFQFSGSCLDALAKIVHVWELPDVYWYQLPNGTIFFGPWRQGPFTGAEVPVDERLVLEKDLDKRTLRLPMIPALRPGMVVNCGFRFRIDELDIDGDTVLIQWTRL